MERIVVIGCSGSGKSRLATALGARLSLPVVHLDAHYWRPGWVQTPEPEWQAMQPKLFAGDRWVADGGFLGTIEVRLERATLAVHLDFPRRTALRGVFGRLYRQLGEVRPDMGPGCPEKFDLEFLKWVWNYRAQVRPRAVAAMERFASRGGAVVTLRSRREVDGWLATVGG